MRKYNYLIFYVFHFLLLLSSCSGSIENKQMGSGKAENKKNKVHYEVYGEGLPILIINGGPGMNSEGFRPLAKQLSENYCAIIFDQRGTGNSLIANPDSNNITMDLMVEDIEFIRKELVINEWVVLGHSFGGMLASHYASLHPDKIKALILSSSGGIDLELFSGHSLISQKLEPEDMDSIKYWRKKIVKDDSNKKAKIKMASFLAPAYVFDKKNVPIIAERLTQVNMTINRLVFSDLKRINFDCSIKLSTFRKPTLIVQGKQDIVPEHISRKAHALFINSNLILIDNCGHYGWLDQNEKYFLSLNNFLSSLAAK